MIDLGPFGTFANIKILVIVILCAIIFISFIIMTGIVALKIMKSIEGR